jgi:hypothetical protein
LPADSARCGRRRRPLKPIRCATPRQGPRCSPTSPGPLVHGEAESQRQPYDLARWAFRPDLCGCPAGYVTHPTQPVAGPPYRAGCIAAAYSRECPRALRAATASVLGDALGIAGRQVFHRYALFVPSGAPSGSMANACRSNGRVNEPATSGC